MTFHQQDKHAWEVESSFLSPWIGNPRTQVQEAGGNSGTQAAAHGVLTLLGGPAGRWVEKWAGSSADKGLPSVWIAGLQRGAWCGVPKNSPPRSPFNQDQREAVSLALAESFEGNHITPMGWLEIQGIRLGHKVGENKWHLWQVQPVLLSREEEERPQRISFGWTLVENRGVPRSDERNDGKESKRWRLSKDKQKPKFWEGQMEEDGILKNICIPSLFFQGMLWSNLQNIHKDKEWGEGFGCKGFWDLWLKMAAQRHF